jgi:hypothetical protein
MGDDPVRASTYAVANLKRVVPNLVPWITKPGQDYDDLEELYGEAVGMWSQYMGHVMTLIGGVNVDFKTAEQSGPVYQPVPKARQKAALDFLAENAIRTPNWLAPQEILSRIGPSSGGASISARQANIVTQLLDARRLARLADSETMDEANAYPLTEYLADARRAVWGTPGTGAAPDANRSRGNRLPACSNTALLSSSSGRRPSGPSGSTSQAWVGSPSSCPFPAGLPYSPLTSSTKVPGRQPLIPKIVYWIALVRRPALSQPCARSSAGVQAPVASTSRSAECTAE